jgi:hypothetical protein
MGVLGEQEPKSLLPVGGEPFAVRLVRQALAHGLTDVTVVVGFRSDYVRERIASAVPSPVRFVVNDRWAEDVNIHSLTLALAPDPSPCLVVEADIWMSDTAWAALVDPADAAHSVWYTRGRFQPDQVGGILRADADGDITDLRIVKAWAPQWAEHDKLVGVTRIGPAQAQPFVQRLVAARDRNLAQYWLMPWIEDLAHLPARARDLGPAHAASVNTPDEYQRLVEMVSAS